jgi:hypothetical protein
LALFLVVVGSALSGHVLAVERHRSTILDVDYRKLVSRADLTYDTPAPYPEAGLPVGNGTMGSMVWTTPGALRLQINRVDVYANNKNTNSFNKRNTDYCGGCGFVDVDFVDFGEDVFPEERTVQHLSVYDGLVTVEGRGVEARVLAWHERDVMAIRVSDQRAEPASIRICLRMLRPPVVETKGHTAASALRVRDGRVILSQEFTEGDYYCGSAVAIGAVGRKGTARAANDKEVRLCLEPGRGTFTILIASGASFDRNDGTVDRALAQLEAAATKGCDGLLEANRAWWRDFWSKSFVHLHSADGVADYVERHYTYFLYIMASSSRGKLPPKFNGMLWNSRGDRRIWGSQHWWNNTSCLYRALPAANHIELMEPMFDMYTGMYDDCAAAARQQWDSKGIFIFETAWFDGIAEMPDWLAQEMRDLYLLRKPWDERSSRFRDFADVKHPHSSRWNWKGRGRWQDGRWEYPVKHSGPYGEVVHIFFVAAKLGYLYWQRYEYTLDEDWLRERAYPMLRGAAEFYRNYPNVRKGEDGKYHIHHANCYEILYGGRDTMEEIAAMRGILPVVIRASEILDVDAEMRPHWRELLDNLAPFPRNDHPDALFPRGPDEPVRWVLSLKPVWRGRRSNHAYTESLVPCVDYGLCTLESEDPEMMRIANATFDSYFPTGIDEETRIGEFSRTPIAAARLGRSADVRELIPIQLRKEDLHLNRLSPSEGNDEFPGTTIEPQGRAAEALHAALCQSIPAGPGQETVIRVFSAWPRQWDAEFKLLCHGGFLVTSSMRKGQVEFVEVHSQLGGECRLRNPWGTAEVALYRDGKPWQSRDGSLLKLKTRKGEDVVMVRKGTSPDSFRREGVGSRDWGHERVGSGRD